MFGVIKILFIEGKEQSVQLTTNPFVIGNVESVDFRLFEDSEKRFFIRIIKNIELNKYLIIFNGHVKVYLNKTLIESNESYVWDFNTKIQIEQDCLLSLVEASDDQLFAFPQLEQQPNIPQSSPTLLKRNRKSSNKAHTGTRLTIPSDHRSQATTILNHTSPDKLSRRVLNKPKQRILETSSGDDIPLPDLRKVTFIPPIQEVEENLASRKTPFPTLKNQKNNSKKTSPVIQIAFIISLFFGAGIMIYSNVSTTPIPNESSFETLAHELYKMKKSQEISEAKANHFYRAYFYETQNIGTISRKEKAKEDYSKLINEIAEGQKDPNLVRSEKKITLENKLVSHAKEHIKRINAALSKTSK